MRAAVQREERRTRRGGGRGGDGGDTGRIERGERRFRGGQGEGEFGEHVVDEGGRSGERGARMVVGERRGRVREEGDRDARAV